MRILLVEDNIATAQTIKDALQEKYILDTCGSCIDAREIAYFTSFDLIILDVKLPDGSGIKLCEEFREKGINNPILILTAFHEEEKLIEALDSGADDYLTKPFSLKELEARIRALLRRDSYNKTNNFVIKNIIVDTKARTVDSKGKKLQLRKKQFDILELLLRKKGRALSREEILGHAWEENLDTFTNTVDVHIKHLRDNLSKITEKEIITTVHGVGYKIED